MTGIKSVSALEKSNSVWEKRGVSTSVLQVLGRNGELWGDGVEGEFYLFKSKYFHISKGGCISF